MNAVQILFRVALGFALLGFVGAGIAHATHLDADNDCEYCKVGGQISLDDADQTPSVTQPAEPEFGPTIVVAPRDGFRRHDAARAPPALLH